MRHILTFFIALLTSTFVLHAQSSWPAEAWNNAINLTSLHEGFVKDLSGAHWNSKTRELWLSINGPGTIVRLVEDGSGGFKLDGSWFTRGDLEGITQDDLSGKTVLVIKENTADIKEYDISSSDVNLVRKWSIEADLPEYVDGNGPEGLTFVPDNWLTEKGFVDQFGDPYVSQNGMGGLIFVGHQAGGNIYVFDLNRTDDSYTFVGEYATNRTETAGLEFDRSTGYLHIWHNLDDNYLEITDLTSVQSGGIRKFNLITEFIGPQSGNIEGIAFTPASSEENWCWFTLDDGDTDALRWFKQFDTDMLVTSIDSKHSPVFNIYPNPTSGRVNIDFKQYQDRVTISVTNICGKVVKIQEFSSAAAVSFNLEGNPGVYFIHTSTGEGALGVQKVLKL